MAFDGWKKTYPRTRLAGTPIISIDKPGAAIAEALGEIQERAVAAVVPETSNVTAKISGNTLYLRVTESPPELPASATQYQVLAWNGSAWVADWVRAHS